MNAKNANELKELRGIINELKLRVEYKELVLRYHDLDKQLAEFEKSRIKGPEVKDNRSDVGVVEFKQDNAVENE